MADDDGNMLNNLLAAGAIYGIIMQSPSVVLVKPVMDGENATNILEVRFDFLKSPYYIKVERVRDERT